MFAPSPQNVTVMFSGVGVEVRVHEGTMAVTVLLPPEFINNTQGLCGLMNSQLSSDLSTQANATAVEMFTFGASCECERLVLVKLQTINQIDQC